MAVFSARLQDSPATCMQTAHRMQLRHRKTVVLSSHATLGDSAMIRSSTRSARGENLQVCLVELDPLAALVPATGTDLPKRTHNDDRLGGVVAFAGRVVSGRFSTMIGNGNQTIEGQRVPLTSTIAELSELLRQNEELRQRLESASRRATEDAELQLRRLGADLHDGPAQLLALALLKLDLLPEGSAESPGEREMIRSVLQDAMSEIRDISAGLALPTIDKLSLAQAAHCRCHGTRTPDLDPGIRASFPPAPSTFRTPSSFVSAGSCRKGSATHSSMPAVSDRPCRQAGPTR